MIDVGKSYCIRVYCVVYSWYRLVMCLRILPHVGHGLSIYYFGFKQYLINVVV